MNNESDNIQDTVFRTIPFVEKLVRRNIHITNTMNSAVLRE